MFLCFFTFHLKTMLQKYKIRRYSSDKYAWYLFHKKYGWKFFLRGVCLKNYKLSWKYDWKDGFTTFFKVWFILLLCFFLLLLPFPFFLFLFSFPFFFFFFGILLFSHSLSYWNFSINWKIDFYAVQLDTLMSWSTIYHSYLIIYCWVDEK